MRANNASMARPAAAPKHPGAPHGCSLLGGLLAVISSMLVVGCAAPPIMQQVDVPVFTSCVKEVPLAPAYEFNSLTLSATDGDKILALARDWPRARKYEGALEAVIEGCR